MSRRTDREAFDALAAKGPVRREGAQRTAEAAWRQVRPLLTAEEDAHLGTAHSHATHVGEGRGEWDNVCAEIRARLWP